MQKTAFELLDALLDDAHGSLLANNSRKAAQHLDCLSKLAGALARQAEQEAQLIELRKIFEQDGSASSQAALSAKVAHHEQAHLAAALETELTEFMVEVRCGSFAGPKGAADKLRSQADAIETEGHNALFPAPMSEEEFRAKLSQSGLSLDKEQSPALAAAMTALSQPLGETQRGA